MQAARQAIEPPAASGYRCAAGPVRAACGGAISWKNTAIRTIADNMIIVPDSKLSSTITTNYCQPQKEVAVRVEAGVACESDLNMVEKVTAEVAAR